MTILIDLLAKLNASRGDLDRIALGVASLRVAALAPKVTGIGASAERNAGDYTRHLSSRDAANR